MLPGKKYTPEDVLKILRKRFWIIVVPWAIIAAGTAAVARKLPDMFRSSANIQIIPPQVPDVILKPMNPANFEQRLQVISAGILTRTRLERVVQDLNLYAEERKTQLPEEIYDRMRKDIAVRPLKGDTFTVTYIGRDRVQVMKVTEKLAGYFRDESIAEGTRRAESTNSFLESQVEESLRKLVEIEDRLKKYRLEHAGEMPEQQAANMNAVQGLGLQLSTIAQQISADQQQVTNLQRMIEQAENAGAGDPTMTVSTTGTGDTVQRGSTADLLAQAKANLAFAKDVRKLGDENPEVKNLRKAVDSLQKQVEAESQRTSTVSSAAVVSANPQDRARLNSIESMKSELDMTKKRIASNLEKEKEVRTRQAFYQARLDNGPAREADIINITREYDIQRGIHNDNVKKRESSSVAVNLERRQIGEQFNLIDQARIPEKPFSPDRMLINMFGIAGGLAVGLALVGLLEYRDSTFKADYEVANVLSLPVLAVVPLMRSDAERKSEFRKHLFLNLGLGSAVAVCLAVLAYTFVR